MFDKPLQHLNYLWLILTSFYLMTLSKGQKCQKQEQQQPFKDFENGVIVKIYKS